jgi:hypothetical protein
MAMVFVRVIISHAHEQRLNIRRVIGSVRRSAAGCDQCRTSPSAL